MLNAFRQQTLVWTLRTKLRADHPFRLITCAAFVILVLQTLVSGAGFSPSLAKASPLINNCGNSNTGHCYAVQQWGGAMGSDTTVTIVPLNCVYSNGCDFINNETWLAQFNNSNCKVYKGACWVEAGYVNDPAGSIQESYFWADVRPGSAYYVHYFGNVPSGDYGSGTEIDIDANCEYQCFTVVIYGATSYFWGQSTNNSMIPTGPHSAIQIGMELAGSSSNGASANSAYFTHNQWYGNSWQYQTVPGTITQEYNPPYIQGEPGAQPGNNGGAYATDCCAYHENAIPPNQFAQTANARQTPRGALLQTPTGVPALTPTGHLPSGSMISDAAVSSYVLHHRMPHTIGQNSGVPTAVQKLVVAKSQVISQLLDGESLGVPANTLLCYVQVSGSFEFLSPTGVVGTYHQGVEVFNATTGNLLLIGG